MEVQLRAVAGYENEEPAGLVACSGSYACWAPEASCAVQVTQLSAKPAQPLLLECGAAPITATALGRAAMGTSDPVPGAQEFQSEELLITASRDAVLAWRLQQIFTAAETGQHVPPPLQVLAAPGHVTCMSLCSISNRLAVCAGTMVHVVDMLSLVHSYRLQGSQGTVLTACFCAPHQPDWLLTAGDDRSYRLWDLHGGSLLYESPVLCASPLITAAVDPSYFRCVLGAADGVLRFFDLSTCPACRCLQVLDVAQHVANVRSAVQASTAAAAAAQRAAAGPKVLCAARHKALSSFQPTHDQDMQPELGQETSFPEVLCSDGVLCLAYSQLRSAGYQGESGLLGESPKLMVGMMRCLAVVDTHSYQVVQLHMFRGAGISLSALPSGVQVAGGHCSLHALPEVEVPAGYSFALASHEQYMHCCCSSASSEDVYLLSCTPTVAPGAAAREAAAHADRYLPGLADAGNRDQPTISASAAAPCSQATAMADATVIRLSVFATKPLPPNSPLMAALKRGRCSSAASSSSSSDGKSKQGAGPVGVRRASEGVLCTPPPALPASLRRACSSDSNSGSKVVCTSSAAVQRRPVKAGSPQKPSSPAKAASPHKPKSKPPPDKPVTFHRQIQSSGYGMLQPSMKLGRPPPAPVQLNTRPTPTNQVAKQLRAARQYPCDGDAPVVLQPQERSAQGPRVHQAAILAMRFSGDGSRLLTASADKSARVLKLPLSKHQGAGTDLLGHNAAVHSASWSQDSTMLLTASADRTARLWHAGCAQPLLLFSHVHQQQRPIHAGQHAGSAAPPHSSPAKDKNPAFLHEVHAAQFFYLDKFIILASGSKMHLYSFNLSEGDPKDDLARLSSYHTYSRITAWTSPAQAITSMSTVNVFQSPLVLLANSSRCVEVVDCTTMQQAACMTDVHARAPHTLTQAAGCSLFTSHPREAQELFATSATDGQLKIWDLRTCQCVRTLSGHKNSQIRVGAAFSPCLRFIASGSEDQATHVYDLRQGTLLHRMRENTDAITEVAFNPLVPQLAAASLTGCLHLYGPI